MKWRNFFITFFLVLGIIATYYIIKEYGFSNIISFYMHFNGWLLLAYICTIMVLYGVLTFRWDIILRSRGHKIGFFRLYIYRIIGQGINFFTPGPRVGGEPTQAALLDRHKVDFTEGLGTIMIDKIIDTSTSGVLFIIGALLVSVNYAIPHAAGIYMTVGAVVFLSFIALFYYQMLHDRHFFLHIFRFFRLENTKNKTILTLEKKVEEVELIMIQFYKHDKKTFILTIVLSLLSWCVMFVEYKIATTLLGLNLGFIQLFFIITFIGIAILFPIPMAVGVLEAGQVSAFNIIQVPGGAGVALAFLVRMKDFFWAIIALVLLAMFGFNVGKTIERKYRRKQEF